MNRSFLLSRFCSAQDRYRLHSVASRFPLSSTAVPLSSQAVFSPPGSFFKDSFRREQRFCLFSECFPSLSFLARPQRSNPKKEVPSTSAIFSFLLAANSLSSSGLQEESSVYSFPSSLIFSLGTERFPIPLSPLE